MTMDDFQTRQLSQDIMEGVDTAAPQKAQGDFTPFQQQLLGLGAPAGKDQPQAGAPAPRAPLPINDADEVTISSALDWMNAAKQQRNEQARRDAEASAADFARSSSGMDESNFIEPPVADGRPGNQPWGMLSPEEARAEVQGTLTKRQAELKEAASSRYLAGTPQSGGLAAFFQDSARGRLKEAEASVVSTEARLAGKEGLPTLTPSRNYLETGIQSFGTSIASVPRFAGIASVWMGQEAGAVDPNLKAEDNELTKLGGLMEAYVKEKFPGDPARQEEFGTKMAAFAGFMASLYGAGGIKSVTQGGPAAVAKIGDMFSKASAVSLAVAPSAMGQYDAATQAMRLQDIPGTKVDETNRITERDRKLATLMGAGIGLSYLIPLGSALATPAERSAGEFLAQTLKGSGITSAQMAGFNVLSNLAAKTTYDPNRSPIEGLQDDMALGAIFGGMTHAISAAGRRPLSTPEEIQAFIKNPKFARGVDRLAPFEEGGPNPLADSLHLSNRALPAPKTTADIKAEMKEFVQQAKKAGDKEPGHENYYRDLERMLDEKFPDEAPAQAADPTAPEPEAPIKAEAAAGEPAEAAGKVEKTTETPEAPAGAPEGLSPAQTLAAHGADKAAFNAAVGDLKGQGFSIGQWRDIASEYAKEAGVPAVVIKSAQAAPTALRKMQAQVLEAKGKEETLQRLAGEAVTPNADATLAAAYPNHDAVAAARVSPDPVIQAVGQALTDVAPGVATLKAGISLGEVDPQTDISQHMSDALQIMTEIQQKGSTPDMYFAGQDTDPAIEALVRGLHGKPNAGEIAAHIVKTYVQEAIQHEEGGNIRSTPAAVQAIRAGAAEKVAERRSSKAGLAGKGKGIGEPVQGEAGSGAEPIGREPGQPAAGAAGPDAESAVVTAGAGAAGEGASVSQPAVQRPHPAGRGAGAAKPGGVTDGYSALSHALKVKTSVEAATGKMPDRLKRAVHLVSQHLVAAKTLLAPSGAEIKPLPVGAAGEHQRDMLEAHRWNDPDDHISIAAEELPTLRRYAEEAQRLSGQPAIAAVEPLILAVKTLAAIRQVGPREYWDEITQAQGRPQTEVQAGFDEMLSSRIPMKDWETHLDASRESMQPMIDAAIEDGRLRIGHDGKLRWGGAAEEAATVTPPRGPIIPPAERMQGAISALGYDLTSAVRAEVMRLGVAIGDASVFPAAIAIAEANKSMSKNDWHDIAKVLGTPVLRGASRPAVIEAVKQHNKDVIAARVRASVALGKQFALKSTGGSPFDALANRLSDDLAKMGVQVDPVQVKIAAEAQIERAYGVFTADVGKLTKGSKAKSIAQRAERLRLEIEDLMGAIGFPARAFGNAGRLSVSSRTSLGGDEAQYHASPRLDARYSEIRTSEARSPTALGHEFFHHLDHYFGGFNASPERSRLIAWMSHRRGKGPRVAEKYPVLTEANRIEHPGTGARPEVQQAWDDLYVAVFKGSSEAAQILSDYDRIISSLQLEHDVAAAQAERFPGDEYAAMGEELARNRIALAKAERAVAEKEIRRGDKGEFAIKAVIEDKASGRQYWSNPAELMARAFESHLRNKLGLPEAKSPLDRIPDADKPAVYTAFDNLFRTLKLRETPQGPEFYALKGVHSTKVDFEKADEGEFGKRDAGFWGRGFYMFPEEYAREFGKDSASGTHYGLINEEGERNLLLTLHAKKPFHIDTSGGLGREFLADGTVMHRKSKAAYGELEKHGYKYGMAPVEAWDAVSGGELPRPAVDADAISKFEGLRKEEIAKNEDLVSLYEKAEKDQGKNYISHPGGIENLEDRAKAVRIEVELHDIGKRRLQAKRTTEYGTIMAKEFSDALIKAGYDAVVVSQDGKAYEMVAIKPGTLKATFGGSDVYALRGFYHPAIRAVATAKQEKATGQQWLATLRNTAGVQARHLEELGIGDWLKEQKGLTSKAKLLAEMRVREAPLEEQVGDQHGPEAIAAEAALNAYLDVQFEPGVTSRDIRRAQVEADAAKIRAKEYLPKYDSYAPFGHNGANPREFVIRDPRLHGQYDEPHFGGPVLVHMRTWDLTGPKGEKLLGVGEIQSTLHQEGRAKGYTSGADSLMLLRKEREILEEVYRNIYDPDSDNARMIIEKIDKISEDIYRAEDYRIGVNPPGNAPLKGDAWLELGIKRMLQHAAENGYDGVTWARSDQIARAVSTDPQKMVVQYDQKIGSFLKKYGKKWGLEVESSDLGLPGKTDLPRLDSAGVGKVSTEALEEAARLGTSRMERETRDWLQSFASDPTMFMDENGAFDPGHMGKQARGIVQALFDRHHAPVNKFIRITDQMRQDIKESGQSYSISAPRAPEPALSPEFQAAWPDASQRVIENIQAMVPEGIRVIHALQGLGDGVEGSSDAARRLIRLALTSGDVMRDMAVGRHEVTHIMRNTGAYSEAEWGKLVERAKKIGAPSRITGEYGSDLLPEYRRRYAQQAQAAVRAGTLQPEDVPGYIEEAINQEYVGKMAEEHERGSTFGTTIDKLLARMRKILDAIWQALRETGFASKDRVFSTAKDIMEDTFSGARARRMEQAAARAEIEMAQGGRIEPRFDATPDEAYLKGLSDAPSLSRSAQGLRGADVLPGGGAASRAGAASTRGAVGTSFALGKSRVSTSGARLVDGYRGFVTQRAPGGSGYGRRSYYLYPENARDVRADALPTRELGAALGELHAMETSPGVWVAGDVNLKAGGADLRGQGIGAKLYDAVENDLRTKLQPSGMLLDNGYRFWLKRDPKSVEFFQELPFEGGGVYFSPIRLLDMLHEFEDLRARTGDIRVLAKLEEQQLQTQQAFDRLPDDVRAAALRQFAGAPGERFALGGGGKKEAPDIKPLAEQISNLKRALGMTSTQGLYSFSIRGLTNGSQFNTGPKPDVKGQYDQDRNVMRFRLSQDIETVAAEGARHMEAIYGKPLQDFLGTHRVELEPLAGSDSIEPLSDGFSAFFKHYLLDPKTAAAIAPKFSAEFGDWLDQHDPQNFRRLEQAQVLLAQKAYQDYMRATTVERGQADLGTVIGGGRDGGLASALKAAGKEWSVTAFASRIYHAAADESHTIRMGVMGLLKLMDANGVKGEDGRPISLKFDENPWKLVRTHPESFKVALGHIQYGIPNWQQSDAGWQVRDANGGLLQTFTSHGDAQAFARASKLPESAIKAAKGYRSASLFDAMDTFTGKKGDWSSDATTKLGTYLESRRAVEEWKSWESKLAQIQAIERGLAATQQHLSGSPASGGNAKVPGVRELLHKAEDKIERRQRAIAQQQKLVQEYERDLAAALKREGKAVSEGITTGIERQKEGRSVQFRNDTRFRSLEVGKDLDTARQRLQDLQKELTALAGSYNPLTGKTDGGQIQQMQATVRAAESALTHLRELRRTVKEGGLQRPPHRVPRAEHEQRIAAIEASNPNALGAAQQVYDFLYQSAIYDFQAGMITKEQLDHYGSRKGFYVPFWRDLGDKIHTGRVGATMGGGTPKPWDFSKQMKGSDRAVINPMESIIQMHQYRVAAAHHNRIISAFSDLAERAGPGGADIAETIPKQRIIAADPDGFSQIETGLRQEGWDAQDAHDMASRIASDYADMGYMLQYNPQTSVAGPITIPYMRSGERTYLRINDPEWGGQLYQALTGLGREMTNSVIDAMGAFSSLIQSTVWSNPAFSSRHAIRTAWAAWILTGEVTNPATYPIVTQARGAWHMARNTLEYRMYHEAGAPMGTSSSAFSKHRDRTSIDALHKAGIRFSPKPLATWTAIGAIAGGAAFGPAGAAAGALIGAGGHRGIRKLPETLAHISDFLELSTRVGVFTNAIKGAIKNNPSLTPYEAYQEAAFVSRSIFDPSVRGSRMRIMLRLVPFMNAHEQHVLQSMLKALGQNDRGLAISPVKTGAAMAAGAAIGSLAAGPVGGWAGAWAAPAAMSWGARYNETVRRAVAPFGKKLLGEKMSREEEAAVGRSAKFWSTLFVMTAFYALVDLLQRDDPEYDIVDAELKNQWQPVKIGGDWHKMPQAFQLGIPAASFRAVMDAQMKDDPRMAHRIISSAYESLIPPMTPQAIRFYSDVSSGNDSFRGKSIVPEHLKILSPQEQYTANTSELAKVLSNAANANPLVRSALETAGGMVFRDKSFQLSPMLIDYSLESLFGYWGRDAKLASNVALRPDSPANDRVTAMPIIGTMLKQYTLNPYEHSDAMRMYWEKMNREADGFPRAAAQYSAYLSMGTGKPGGHAGLSESDARSRANTYLASLHPEERVYALVQNEASSQERRLHPVNRLKDIVSVVNQMNTDMLQNGLSDTSAKKGTVPIPVGPGRFDTVKDLLTQYAAIEANNSMIFLKLEQFAGRRQRLDPGSVLDVLKADEPVIYKELQTRLSRQHVQPWSVVERQWPILQDRLLENWQRSMEQNRPMPGAKLTPYRARQQAADPAMEGAQ